MTAHVPADEWAKARAAAMDAIPGLVQDAGLPSVLLPYQARAISLLDGGANVLFVEKSRRIGMTWGLAAWAVLRGAAQKQAGGMDVMYISYSKEMTREFVDACAMWARAFDVAASAAEEVLFDQGKDDRAINAFRIKFASGFEIMGLSSAPRGLRGKQGIVIIDEAAFVDDLEALLKSALANLIWGGKVVVCSTHLGFDNPFNETIQDILAGRVKYAHMRVTLDDALEQGLYQRIALVKGEAWSPAAEAAFREGIIADYRDNADEELYCVPSLSSGTWLAAPLIEARMTVATPVLRLDLPPDYMHRSTLDQAVLMAPFLAELRVQLDALDLSPQFAFGSDFGRNRDLTTGSLLAIEAQLKRREVLAYELRRVPGKEQKLIARTVLDHVRHRLVGAAFDATGMGWTVAEDIGRLYGLAEKEDDAGVVRAIKFSEEWYRVHMPPLKAAFEDDALAIIRDAEHLGDLRLVKLIRGIARVPPERTGGTGNQRHGDYAIGLALAHYASRQRFVEYGYRPVTGGAGGGQSFLTPADQDDRAWRRPLGSALWGVI